jgi:hypothetical protein
MQNASSLVIWRDSVCAGDDFDGRHELTLSLPLDASLRQLTEQLLNRRYLASLFGGRATWIFEAGCPLAVFAQQWIQPRFLVSPDEPLSSFIKPNSQPHFNFRYWCQVDPDRVFDCLQRGEPLPDRYGRGDPSDKPPKR